ncbi:hypothetical protein [Lacticaseibacillus sp. GG6-2]
MEKQQILTTKLDYELDLAALQHDYRFVLVRPLDKETYPKFYRLLSRWQAVACALVTKGMLVMVKDLPDLADNDGLQLKQVWLNEMEDDKVYANHILQLLLNLQADGTPALAEPSLTPKLLIVRSKWVWQKKEGFRQCYGLEVTIGWQGDLEMRVRTFTEQPAPKKGKPAYVLNVERGCLQRATASSQHPVFVEGNGTKHRNQVHFLAIQNLAKFRLSKVGVATQLLANLNANERGYLNQPVRFHQSEVTMFDNPKLESTRLVWQKLTPLPLTIYAQVGDELSAELAKQVDTALQHSPLVRKAGLKVQLGAQAEAGWNIQVVRDLREKPAEDQYQVGDADTVIQHVTVENFGGYDEEKKELTWQPTGDDSAKDAGADPALIKLAQELLIRQDMMLSQLASVDPKLVAEAQKFAFYRVEFMHESPQPEVMVVGMHISENGGITFDKQWVNLDHLEANDHATQLCHGLLVNVLYGVKKAYQWDTIDCIVEADGQQLVIQSLARSTMPDGERILKQLAQSNLDHEYSSEEILAGLDQARPYVSGEGVTALNQVQALLPQLPLVFPLKQLDALLRNAGFSPKQAGMKQLNAVLEAHANFTFKNTLQRKMPNSPMAGMKGMGLVRIDQAWQYFVGTNTSLRQTIHRGALLRRLYPLQGDDETVMTMFPILETLMSVEFVRNAQYTVMPFPAKYLREYWSMQVRQHPAYRRPKKPRK